MEKLKSCDKFVKEILEENPKTVFSECVLKVCDNEGLKKLHEFPKDEQEKKIIDLLGNSEGKKIIQKAKQLKKDNEKILKNKNLKPINTKFLEPELILNILDELDKLHMHDNAEKLASFIIILTGLLEPNNRQSLALCSNSSEGKDNLLNSCIKMIPPEAVLKLTNATQAALQDDITEKKILVLSELNLFRENGANSSLLEIIKQLSEGGSEVIKKNIADGFKSVRHEKQDQKTICHGSTDEQVDSELTTREFRISIKANSQKIKAVNKNTLKKFKDGKSQNNLVDWVVNGLNQAYNNKIKMPYLDNVPVDWFDTNDPRSMRDLKKFLSCVSSITFLYQFQRRIDAEGFIISEPQDFILATIIIRPFLNLTYEGFVDIRHRDFLDVVNDYCDKNLTEIFPRLAIQKALGVSLSTIKRRSKAVQEVSKIQFERAEGNDVWFRRCSQGVQKVFITCSVKEIIKHFQGVQGVHFPQIYCDLIQKLQKRLKSNQKDNVFVENEHPMVNTLNTLPQKNNPVLANKNAIFDWNNVIHQQCQAPECNAKECNLDSENKTYCENHWQRMMEEVVE